jgi:phospholipid/cholesterol/gamma-HCH transport system substrate-binding protein
MRRLAGIVLGAVLIGWGASALASSGSAGTGTGRFDVIFDNARGLVPGQLVKIAGARAGTISAVHLTPGFKARIEATVPARFMPFHQDATCAIRPEGLIAENYLECDPGTAGSPPLRGSNGYPPTVPLTRTTEPVSLLDVFNTFTLSTRQRLTVLLNELGIATAGRGQDLNQILLRANPTLALARRTIDILLHQQSQLKALIDSTAAFAAQGAAHTSTLRTFLDRAAAVASLTADHRSALSQGINRLPGLLVAARPALSQLDAVARNGTPLLHQLQAAAPVLDQVSRDLKPFAAAATPGLARMASALRTAIPSLHQSLPLLGHLENYARRSLPSTELTAKLYENLQRHGYVESFLAVAYYVATSLSRFDSTSHLLPLLLVAPHNGQCGRYATKPVAGCSAHYGSEPAYRPERGPVLQALTNYLIK